MESYLRVNLLGPGPRLIKQEFTGPRSHRGWETLVYRKPELLLCAKFCFYTLSVLEKKKMVRKHFSKWIITGILLSFNHAPHVYHTWQSCCHRHLNIIMNRRYKTFSKQGKFNCCLRETNSPPIPRLLNGNVVDIKWVRPSAVTRWFKYDRDWFVWKQAALRSSCATLGEWSHNLHSPSCSG